MRDARGQTLSTAADSAVVDERCGSRKELAHRHEAEVLYGTGQPGRKLMVVLRE
jgi:hypothetical protein